MKQKPIVLNPQLAWREIEGRVVVISPADSIVHELNETASAIWKHADQGCSAAEIADLISGEFSVDVNRAKIDTESLLAVFAQKGLVTS